MRRKFIEYVLVDFLMVRRSFYGLTACEVHRMRVQKPWLFPGPLVPRLPYQPSVFADTQGLPPHPLRFSNSGSFAYKDCLEDKGILNLEK